MITERPRNDQRRGLWTVLYAVMFLASATMWQAARVHASDAPRPPCQGNGVLPSYAPVGPHPTIEVWFDGDLPEGWTPPDCLGWKPQDMDVLVATAGRFDAPGGLPAILGRMAAVSDYPRMRYWSATRQIWRPLVEEAVALSGPDKSLRRADFRLDELVTGSTHYFWQVENTPADALVYRLEIRDRRPDRLVLALENAHALRFLLLPLFEPGEYQSLLILEREQSARWRYYGLQRATNGVSLSTRDHRSSYVNRAAALFRYVAGLPTDTEPPLAPK